MNNKRIFSSFSVRFFTIDRLVVKNLFQKGDSLLQSVDF